MSIFPIPSSQALGLPLPPASPSSLPYLVFPEASLCTQSPLHATLNPTPEQVPSTTFDSPRTTAKLLRRRASVFPYPDLRCRELSSPPLTSPRASSEPAGLATQVRCLPDPRPPEKASSLHPTGLRHLSASSFSRL